MKPNTSRILAIASVVAISVIWIGAATANAQSDLPPGQHYYYPATPPQGPPPASGGPSLSVDVIFTVPLNVKVDQMVSDNNQCYWPAKIGAPSCFRDGIQDSDHCIWGCMKGGHFISRPEAGAIISVSKTRYSPWMYATQYSDRPNQNVALTTYSLTYNVSGIFGCSGGVCVDYPFSRTLGQSIDIYTSCQNYWTATGVLTQTTVISAPVLDTDHSLLEDTIGGILFNNVIPNFVDSEIRAALGGASGTISGPIPSLATGTIACNRLGVFTFPGDPKSDAITFDFIRPRVLLAAAPQITVQVTQVRRLPLHYLDGSPIYYPTESPRLELYAGHSKLVVSLPQMVENQTFFVGSGGTVSIPAPSDQLVLVANMRDDTHNTLDSTYAVFDKTSNFGNGTQLITSPKVYFMLDPRISRKPIIMYGKGYEITLRISAPFSSPTIRTIF